MANSRTLAAWQAGGDPDEPRPDGSDPEPRAAVIHAPGKYRVVLACPECGDQLIIDAALFGRRTKDSDGTSTVSLRTKAAKVAHSCDQLTLDAAATGPLVR